MRRWLCVASTPGTGDSQALAPAPRARSLAPPPPPPPPSPRRPNPPAHTDPKGREPACLAPRNRGRRGGKGRLGTRRTPHRSHPVRPGEPAPTAAAVPGAQVGGGDRASQAEKVRTGVTHSGKRSSPSTSRPLPLSPSSHSRVMSLTPRGRPRMCPSSSYVSRDQLCMVALSTLAKTPTLRGGFPCLEQKTLGRDLGGSGEPRDSSPPSTPLGPPGSHHYPAEKNE